MDRKNASKAQNWVFKTYKFFSPCRFPWSDPDNWVDAGVGGGVDPEDGSGRRDLWNGGVIAGLRVPGTSRVDDTGSLELVGDVRGTHREGKEIPTRAQAKALNACVGGKGTGDAGDAGVAVEDVFGGLVVVADFEVLAHVNSGLGT